MVNGVWSYSSMAIRQRRAASFAGCGFMSIYYVGIGLAVQEHAPNFLKDLNILYGASAGAVFAVTTICGNSPMDMYEFMKECYDLMHSLFGGHFAALHPKYKFIERERAVLERSLSLDAHKKCRGKVGVSLTILPSMENWIVSDFNTRAELIQALVCSAFVPLYCGYTPPKFRGKYCCDGGFSSNIPFSNDPMVITVSPFSGECDICPASDNESYYQVYLASQTIDISLGNLYRGIGALFCRPWSEMEAILKQGYDDTINFLGKEGVLTTRIELPLTRTTPTNDICTSDYDSLTTSNSHSHCSSTNSDITSSIDESNNDE